MNARSSKRLVREGDLVAEVDVKLLEAEGAWTPYLSVEDAYKLDDVRDALRAGDVKRASRFPIARGSSRPANVANEPRAVALQRRVGSIRGLAMG